MIPDHLLDKMNVIFIYYVSRSNTKILWEGGIFGKEDFFLEIKSVTVIMNFCYFEICHIRIKVINIFISRLLHHNG